MKSSRIRRIEASPEEAWSGSGESYTGNAPRARHAADDNLSTLSDLGHARLDRLEQVYGSDGEDAATAARRLIAELSSLLPALQLSESRPATPVSRELLRLCDRLGALVGRAGQHPSQAHLQLLHIEISLLCGRWSEVALLSQALLSANVVLRDGGEISRRLLILDTQAALALGHTRKLDELALTRLYLLAARDPARIQELFAELAPAIAALDRNHLTDDRRGALLFWLARAMQRARSKGIVFLRKTARRRLRMQFYRCLAALISASAVLLLRATSGRAPASELAVRSSAAARGHRIEAASPRRRILVTRAMGGIGDILTMTPGLAAAARVFEAEISFATLPSYFPFLRGVPGIRLLDIGSSIEPSHFDRCFNFSECPATAYERRTIPQVRQSRVETFAYALGLSAQQLREQGLRPLLALSPAQEHRARQRRQAWAGKGKTTVVGVQAFSRDHYKSVPQLPAILSAMEGDYRFIVFCDQVRELPVDARFMGLFAEPYEDVIAAASACDYIVTVDSFLLHLAAALDKPALALFGPTDAAAFARHLSRKVVVQMKDRFPCSPCWRNEHIRCQVFDQWSSVCLDSMDAGQIHQGLAALEAMYPRASDGHQKNVSDESC